MKASRSSSNGQKRTPLAPLCRRPMQSPPSRRSNSPAHAAVDDPTEDDMKPTIALLAGGLALAGCSDMNQTQQRALSGTAIGTAGGAVLGAIGGNAALGAVAGAAAGLAGGLIYDSVKKNEQSAYQQGYTAGKSSSSTTH